MWGALPRQALRSRPVVALLLALALGARAGGSSAPQGAQGASSGLKPFAEARSLEASAPTVSVSQLEWSDTNSEAGQIGGGVVRWVPPSDVSQITNYDVYIAHDDQGSYRARLWNHNSEEDLVDTVAVGTNQFVVYESTKRQTAESDYPANWLLVYTRNDAVQQATADAAKIRLYDHSDSIPGALPFDTDSSAVVQQDGTGLLLGDVLWSLPPNTDLGFVETYEVFMSTSPDSADPALVASVPVGTTQFTLDGSLTCEESGLFGLLAKNRVGPAETATWLALEACPDAVLPSTTAATGTDDPQPGVVTQTALVFVDTNDEAGQIGGALVTWSPTPDSTVTHYEVYISYDDEGTHKAKLVWEDPDTDGSGSNMPVGTNQFQIYSPTARRTMNNDYPANWLVVFGSRGGVLESVSTAKKVRLYDLSKDVPDEVAMSSVIFTDTDSADERIAGSVEWTTADKADLGMTTNFSVYLAKDSLGTDEVLLKTVQIGTNQLLLNWGTECWDNNHLIVYAANPNGKAAQGAVKLLDGCTTAANTTAVTTTSVTTTKTTLLTFVSNVELTDSNSEAGQIGGALVQWTPPTDASAISHYELFIAYDRIGTYQAQLWWQKGSEIAKEFPVGTNSANLHQNTGRATSNGAFPANWLLVYSVVNGVRHPLNEASAARIYDLSTEPPGPLGVTIAFTDTDPADPTIAGVLQWEVEGLADFGFTTEYEVMLARDASGTGKVSLESVPIGTNELVIADGTACWDRNHLLIYARNPIGRASSATSQQLVDCTTPPPTTTKSTITVSVTSVTGSTLTTVTRDPDAPVIPASSISDLSFTDTNLEAYQIGGAVVEWEPPADESLVTHYEVYIASDSSGSHKAQLWYDLGGELNGAEFPVGVNQIHLFSPTTRQSADAAYPANWVLVYSKLLSGETGEAVKVPLYDASSSLPGDATLELNAEATSLSPTGELEGVVGWEVSSAQADLGFVESLGVYLAADASGTDQQKVDTISLETDSFSLPAGHDCSQSGFLALYLQNPNGQALANSWLHLPPCAPTTSTTTSSLTTQPPGPPEDTSTTRTTTVEDHRISHLHFEDLHIDPFQIGGAFVQWVPPIDLDGVTHYQAYIAYDSLGTHQAQLWFEVPGTYEIGDEIPVGTNEFFLFHNTKRRTWDENYPANWLIVYAVYGTTLQANSDAAKIPLYDWSSQLPVPLFTSSMSFVDTDPADERIAGRLSWEPEELSDFGFTQHFEVFLAKNGMGWGAKTLLGTVDLLTTELIIPNGTYCWDNSFLLVYTANPNGQSLLPASHQMDGCITPPPTTTTTASTATTVTNLPGAPTVTGTTTTASTTQTLDPTRIWTLEFTDNQMEANEIGGAIIEWVPPVHMSGIDHFEVYISYDEIGTHQAQLWWSHPVTEKHDDVFPVGTNRFYIWDPTRRQTHDANYPANWVLVYGSIGGVLQPVSDAAKVPLYDASPNRPGSISDLVLDFSDQDPADETIQGTLGWTVQGQKDFGFTKDFAVYLATDAQGAGRILLAEASVDSREVVIPTGTHCWDRNHILLYPRNPNGLAPSASSLVLEGCTTPDPAALNATSTGTSTTTVTPVPAVSDLLFVDMDPEANQIGGAVISWTPPDDLSQVTGYEVYIAHDELGTHMAQLWYTEFSTGDIYPTLPVGTNEFHVAVPTTRQTMSYGIPANWLITATLGPNGKAQDVATAAKVPLYDKSSDVPDGIGMVTNFLHVDSQDAAFGGTLQWTVLDNTDLGFMTHFSVFQLNSTAEMKLSVDSVPVGTNQLVVPSGTPCSNGDFLVVYAGNPNGLAAEPAGSVPDICKGGESVTTPAPAPPPKPDDPLFSFPLIS